MGPGRPPFECENDELVNEFELACRSGDYEFAEEYKTELLKRLAEASNIGQANSTRLRVAGNPRVEVAWFADRMEAKLKENDHKSHWSGCDDNYLLNRMYQEYYELVDASETGKGLKEIINEAADVANFCMMIADNARRRLNG